jgi:hypothetical protein
MDFNLTVIDNFYQDFSKLPGGLPHKKVNGK